MASSSTQQLLKLIIKSANQKYDDFVVDNFDLNWTIKRLKQYLNDNYPRNPVQFLELNFSFFHLFIYIIYCRKLIQFV
jgi:hypothetical protein